MSLSLPFWSKDPRHFLKRVLFFFYFSQYCNHGGPLAFIWLGKDPTVGTISFPVRNPFKLRSEDWASAFGRIHGAQVRDIQDNVWKGCGGSSRQEVSWYLSWYWFHSGPYLSWTAPVGRGPVLCGRSVCSHARAWLYHQADLSSDLFLPGLVNFNKLLTLSWYLSYLT